MSTMPSGMQDPERKDKELFWKQQSASKAAPDPATARSDRSVHITFAHVSGFGKVKQELQEVVTFLQTTSRARR